MDSPSLKLLAGVPEAVEMSCTVLSEEVKNAKIDRFTPVARSRVRVVRCRYCKISVIPIYPVLGYQLGGNLKIIFQSYYVRCGMTGSNL